MNAPTPPATLVRTRLHGTDEHAAKTAADVIAASRYILATGYAKINGVMMDSTTAGMLVAVHDAIQKQTKHPDYWSKVEAMFAKLLNTGEKKAAKVALVWLVNFGWRLAR